MITAAIYSLLSVLVVSAVSLVGLATIWLKEDLLKKYIFIFVSLAIGAMLGDAFIHLIPEAFAKAGSALTVSLAIVAGILMFLILEKALHWHHHLEDEDSQRHVTHPVGTVVLVGDGVHNFIDGILIGASYLAGVEIGIATTIAVILHEIPQEIGDFGVLIHAGFTRHRALFYNFLSALSAVLGAVVVLVFGDSQSIMNILLPVAAGGFIYIAMADLIPELHKTQRQGAHMVLEILFIIVGVLAMIGLLFLE